MFHPVTRMMFHGCKITLLHLKALDKRETTLWHLHTWQVSSLSLLPLHKEHLLHHSSRTLDKYCKVNCSYHKIKQLIALIRKES